MSYNSVENVLLRTEGWLRDNKIQDFYRTSNKINFKVSFFGWSWDKFGAFDSGYFLFQNSCVDFEASTFRMFFLTLIFSCLIGFKAGWFFGIVVFVLLFFGNLLISFYQVKDALRKINEGLNSPTK